MQPHKAERIAIVGVSGSGKTTLARALAAKTGLPLYNGDQLEWLSGWRERPTAELVAIHEEWIAQPRWIIEGWIDPQRVARLNASELVVDLDPSRWICAARVTARMLRGLRREEMPEGCIDPLTPHLLHRAFFRKERPSIDAALALSRARAVARLTSPHRIRAWLDAF